MSMRRPLGTGPTTSTRTTTSPRLLPVERAELVDADEHQDLEHEHRQEPAAAKGRRPLAQGPSAGQTGGAR
jgi:hypothetical protein